MVVFFGECPRQDQTRIGVRRNLERSRVMAGAGAFVQGRSIGRVRIRSSACVAHCSRVGPPWSLVYPGPVPNVSSERHGGEEENCTVAQDGQKERNSLERTATGQEEEAGRREGGGEEEG